MKRIAFDLDNTLIRCGYDFPTEKPKRKFVSYFFKYEPLRSGITELVKRCEELGYKPCVYTSSYRKLLYIKRVFWLYKIKLEVVVNQKVHDSCVRLRCSKFPPAFDMAVLVDDSLGIAMKGAQFQFNAIIVSPEDTSWVEHVMQKLLELE